MADSTTAARVKAITNSLERAYQSLNTAASNIAGLLQLGRATCDEIRAYNLWALSVYNQQRGMLTSLRNAGESVPALPGYPTLFAWRGVDGSNAINIDCSGEESSLSGTMRKALGATTAKTVFLSTNEVQIVTQGQWQYNPDQSPSLASMQAQQLGVAPIIILIIAGLSIAVYFAIDAIAAYLTESDIQKETTERTAIQAQAFSTYTRARLDCYADCTGRGNSLETCVDTCAKLVTPPDIKIDSARGIKDWTAFQWIGFTVTVAVGAIAVWKIREKHQRGESILPDWAHLPGG